MPKTSKRDMITMATKTASTLREALDLLRQAGEADRILDPDGSEIFSDGRGGAMYADGASVLSYGPFSDM
jgi:hypothetical protein